MARCASFLPPSLSQAGALIRSPPSLPLVPQANTMLSYPLPTAHDLLSAKLASAQSSLANVKEDLEWLRDQITVTEVNVARVYNWDVKRRRERREAGL